MNRILVGDVLDVLRALPEKSVDLVFGSPPYEDARAYGMDFKLSGQAWVDWMVSVVRESLRACRGLVAFVVAGRTRNFRWSATPALLMADLHRAGVCLRTPPLYVRDGIPGSGGKDWLKSHYEFIICATNGGRLPWSDNTACGHPPKYKPGGAPSHQTRDGRVFGATYKPPKLANPGNLIDCGCCGGGHLGSELAHENEAPFPEKLADFFVRSFCPPGGTVLDPFSGSGTTAAVAEKTGRNYIATDLRPEMADLTARRVKEVE